MYLVELDDFSGWRRLARELLKRGVAPEDIIWQQEKQSSLLFGEDANSFLSLAVKHSTLNIPNEFFSIAKSAACYRDESRWALLYSVAWRLIFEDRNLLQCKIDAKISRLFSMRKAVGRDIHKMEAFVRFCLVKNKINKDSDESNSKPTLNDANAIEENDFFVSWFEPEHLIVRAAAPFFVKRFNNMSWSILTPDLCAHWNQKEVSFTQGIARPSKVEDDLETLWREYYANIFNPARLKLKAMQSEMPKKYWVNLPEAPLIAELTRSSGKQLDSMVNDKASQPWNKTAKSRYVKEKQKELRERRENNQNSK